MICQKQFTITVDIDCDTLGEAVWTVQQLDGAGEGTMTLAGGDGSVSIHVVGDPNAGSFLRGTSNTMACPHGSYNATVEIDYNIFLEEFGAGSQSSVNISVRRNGALVINYALIAPNGGSISDSGTLSSGVLAMLSGTSYSFRIDFIVSCSGLGVADVDATIRLRPLTPP